MKIDGRAIAQDILNNLKGRMLKLRKKGLTPHLAIILVGNDPPSKVYVSEKAKKARAIGAKVTIYHLPFTVATDRLRKLLKKCNDDEHTHGIIVQRPLPPHIDQKVINEAVLPEKDVDGFNPQSKFKMPLAEAVLHILRHIFQLPTPRVGARKILAAKSIVVIGKGKTSGWPIIEKLHSLGVRPLIIDSKTQQPQEVTKNADILISAVGKPNVIKPEMVKKGVILISVGLYKGPDGKLRGDYEEEEIENIASFYTPTPGGVGPVNVAMLLTNLVEASERFHSAGAIRKHPGGVKGRAL